MSNNVALDLRQMDSTLSAISSSSQSSGSASPTCRIFFGPLQSPEKKFMAPSSSPSSRTPVRRSALHSSAMVPLPLFSETAESSHVREGTPEEEGIPDEPSVILASRILSACSNPSPPPSPPLPAPQNLPETDDVQLFDVSEPGRKTDAYFGSRNGLLIPVDSLDEPIASSPFAPRPSTSILLQEDDANVSQPDLIAFDSFSTPNASYIHIPSSTPSRDAAVRNTPASVDDLLSMSPNSPTAQPEPQQISTEYIPTYKDATATPNEEVKVANSLVIEVDPPPTSQLLADTIPPEENHASASAQIADDPVPANEKQSPPLRRSSRPRRSRSSLPQTIVRISPEPLPPKLDSVGIYKSAAESADGSLRNPQRKRKLKATPVSDDKAEDYNVETHITPRQLPQVARVQQELGDLSPISTAVLTQLFPGASDGGVSGPSIPQQLQPSGEGDVQLSEVPTTPAPSTPPHQTVALIFPKIGSTDGSSSEVQRPKSPLRPFSPSKVAEGSRTPARRVPIAQAVAEGTYSAQKLPTTFATMRPSSSNQPSSPVFKRIALDDPARSPAKRVPMSEAVPMPPPSPGKSVDKGKSKVAFRPQSPLHAPSVPLGEHERIGSAEPQPPARRVRGSSAEPAMKQSTLARRSLFQKPASSDGVLTGVMKSRTTLPFPLVQQARVPTAIPEANEPGSSVVHHTMTAPGTGVSRPARVQISPAKSGSSLRQPSAGSGSKIPRMGVKPYARPRSALKADSVAKSKKIPNPAETRVAQKSNTLRIIPVGSSSGSSSDEGHGPPNASVPLPTLMPRRVATPVTSSNSADVASGKVLKRKREPDTASSKLMSSAQPVIVIRKVVPGMFNKGKDVAPAQTQTAAGTLSNSVEPLSSLVAPSPVRPTGPIRARSAVGWKRPQQEASCTPSTEPSVTVERKTPTSPPKEPSQEPSSVPATTEAPTSSPVKEHRQPSPPPQTSIPIPPGSNEATTSTEGTVTATVAGPVVEPSADQPSTRRSTRSRRTTAPATDVFGSVVQTGSVRPLQLRRRGPLPSETAGPFAGMSALALKTLTSANTLKNQQQIATIQTEIVRKDGNRPDSPTTRVRSALEKQKEQRVQQRKERAERRARRSAGSDVELDTNIGSAIPIEDEGEPDGAGEAGGASFMTVECEPEEALLRHRRGPGDEEDYETPPRPERPVKRGRFEGTEGADAEDTRKDRRIAERRVKWYKGLHTTVYLNDKPPNPNWDVKAAPSNKGCLTPAAKAVRLDTLGNVLNAEVPVGGLIKEQVVVKKFVFDDDVPPEVAPTAPVAKSTRSRSKKAKS